VFVRLDETGADGLIPVRALGREFFHFDADSQTLMGSDSGVVLGIGQRVTVRLSEAVPVTGGLILDLVAVEGATLPVARRKPGKYQPRKPAQAAAKRRVVRRRK
jgi:ribonuclease R